MIQIFAGLLGGIGLFILGMQLMTDGLKHAAGRTLRNILARSTKTTLRGLLSGAFITSMVQSSSAVTVATIGFVNAGLMDLGRAVTVIYGSNVGTTMTGWLVALIGFKVSLKAFALPAVGIGMFMRIFLQGKKKMASLGESLAGFGLFFIGVDQLKTVFSGVGNSIQMDTLVASGLPGMLVFVGIGLFLTFAMQSSSAAMAIILTANAGGMVPLEAAAATVIGANLGTTSTAALASIGATPNAKRTAGAHVIFNIGTSAVALLVFPLIFSDFIKTTREIGIFSTPTELLALFHTLFNILGVLIFLPLTKPMVNFLKRRFRSTEEDESQPMHLDRTLLSTPTLALNAMAMELSRVGVIATRMAKSAMSTETAPGPRLSSDRKILRILVGKVGDFCNSVFRKNLPAELDLLLPNALRVSGHYAVIADLAMVIAKEQSKLHLQPIDDLDTEIAHFKANTVSFLGKTDITSDAHQPDELSNLLVTLQDDYQHLKTQILRAGTQGLLSTKQMVIQLEIVSQVRQIAERADKATRYLASLTDPVEGSEVTESYSEEGLDD